MSLLLSFSLCQLNCRKCAGLAASLSAPSPGAGTGWRWWSWAAETTPRTTTSSSSSWPIAATARTFPPAQKSRGGSGWDHQGEEEEAATVDELSVLAMRRRDDDVLLPAIFWPANVIKRLFSPWKVFFHSFFPFSMSDFSFSGRLLRQYQKQNSFLEPKCELLSRQHPRP